MDCNTTVDQSVSINQSLHAHQSFAVDQTISIDQPHTLPHSRHSTEMASSPASTTSNGLTLLKLPIELRWTIWELLLPEPKVLLAKKRDIATDEDWARGVTSRPQFYLEPCPGCASPSHPLLAKICRDSRDFLSLHGGFAFGNPGEGGLWWNKKKDVLVIDHTWEHEPYTSIFDDMTGLENIGHVALDATQAADMAYDVTYHKEEANNPRDARHPLAIAFMFRGYYKTFGTIEHFLPRLFTGLQTLSVYFFQLNDPGCCGHAGRHTYETKTGCRAHPCKIISEGSCVNKVDIAVQGVEGMRAAAATMERLRHLWSRVNRLALEIDFHMGGRFVTRYPWVSQPGNDFGNDLPMDVGRRTIRCEEMMEDYSFAL
ncbi:hypothetical protein J7T55_001483 [Diaporthe amygdali]|uniref:uncharacterized protein n=1 Tax=Phomopsis amygdali TaxID=1214568 RepID=UPI0022FE7369|nr:uncharacterized protein J7T55_001483 [Diaporthe amygdali]KAJ0115074.1 hypothetical protein J7T55_001483 [Diaporthe amygdali]